MSASTSATEKSSLSTKLFAFAAACCLTACGGGGGGGGPDDHIAELSLGGSVAGAVNQASASSVTIVVTTDSAPTGTRYDVTVTDGLGATASAFAVFAGEEGTLPVGPIDASNLADGTLTARVRVTVPPDTVVDSTQTLVFTKDTVAPEAPASVALVEPIAPPWPTPVGTVNSNNAAEASFSVTFTGVANADETLVVRVADTLGASATSGVLTPPASGGSIVTTLDLRELAEGPLTVSAVVADAAENTSSVGVSAHKDTFVRTPVAAWVAAGASNAQGVVNLATVNAVRFDVDLPATGEVATDAIVVTVRSGVATVSSALLAANLGGGVTPVLDVDILSLADGTLAFDATVVDEFGNAATLTGGTFLKDTQVGALLPVSVPANGTSPAGMVNAATAGAVSVVVPLDAGVASGDEVVLQIWDGVTAITQNGSVTTAGPGSLVFGPMDLSGLLDGSLLVTLTHSDPQGNARTGSGGSIDKDTLAPTAPTSLGVAAGPSNAAHQINSSNAAATLVDVVFHASMTGAESASVRLTDTLGASVTLGSLVVPPGGGTQVVGPFDVSGLTDGSVAVSITLVDPTGNSTTANGTPATLFQAGPPAPASAAIFAGPSNPSNVINTASAANVAVRVVFGVGAQATHQAAVTLTDGVLSVLSAPQSAPSGGGTLIFSGIDASSLGDGSVAVVVEVFDTLSLGSTSFTGTVGTKDTVAPSTPTSLFVRAGSTNAQNVINATSASLTAVRLTLPGTYAGSETVTISLTDGASTVTAPAVIAPVGGGIVDISGLNVTGLVDGPITLSALAVDAAGNSVAMTGTAALKDTLAPTAPVSAGVAAGPTNAPHVIDVNNQSAVMVDVNWDPSMDGSESVQVTFSSSGGGMTTLGPITPPIGGGAAQIGPADLSGLTDGTVGIAFALTDTRGNTSNFAGTSASMNTAGPAVPDTIVLTATASNPQGYVNAANASAAAFSLTWNANAQASDTVIVTVSDGISSLASAPSNAPSGSGSISVVMNLASLTDGPLSVAVQVTATTAASASVFSQVTKDTVAPSAVLGATVAAGANNPVATINAASVTSVRVDVSPGAGYDGSEALTVALSDGGATVMTTTSTTTGPGTQTVAGLNGSSLSDGPIGISITISDVAGNVIVSAGTAATKDVIAPAAPSSLAVAAGASNAAHQVLMANQAAVVFAVTFDPSMTGTEQAVFELMGPSATSAATGPLAVPLGGGAINMGSLDASALADGSATVRVTVSDVAGNPTVFVGTQALVDTTVTAAPALARVSAGLSNSANVVNVSNVGAILVDVTFSAGDAGDLVTARLTDGGTTLTFGPQNAPNGFGTLSFGPLDGSALADGTLAFEIQVDDPFGNQAIYAGPTVSKDASAPVVNSFRVDATANNPRDFVNEDSQTNVHLELLLGPDFTGAEIMGVVLSDGTNHVLSGVLNPNPGGGSMILSGYDVTGIPDGNLTLLVSIIDPAGNRTDFFGTAATKDVVDPVAPIGVNIAAGLNNPLDVLNAANIAAFSASSTLDPSMAGDETASVQLTSSGGGVVFFFAQPVPLGGGPTNFGPFDGSALGQGSVSIVLTLTDPAGNTSFVNGSAVLDTIAPATPVAIHVPLGVGNALDVINSTNVATATIDVDLPAGSEATDTVHVEVTDGVTTLDFGMQLAAGGAGVANFGPIDCSTLSDGALTLTVVVTDAATNPTSLVNMSVTKDTGVPAAPASANVVSGGGNTLGFISAASVANVTIDVVHGVGWDPTDAITVTLSDGINSVSSATVPAGAGPTTTVSGIDATPLNEQGGITVSVQVEDTAANVSTYNTGTCTKDVTVPGLPSLLSVSPGPSNAVDVVNSFNVAAVMVGLTYGGSMTGGEVANFAYGDGVTAVFDSVPGVTTGAASAGPVNLSGLAEGALTVQVEVSDAAGNASGVISIPVVKDTIVATPTGLTIEATINNPATFVNASTVAAASARVSLDAGSLMSDTLVVDLGDGASTVSSAPGNPGVDGVTTLALAVNATTLLDGPISLSVTVTDDHGNTANLAGTPATKDVLAPSAAVGVSALVGAQNPVGFVNAASVSAAVIAMTLQGDSSVSDVVVVTVEDAALATVVSPGDPGINGGGATQVTLDLTALQDGALTLSVDITDAAGNTAVSAMGAATKDVVAPDMTQVQVSSSLTNARFEVNSTTVSAVAVEAAMGAAGATTDALALTFSDGTNPDVTAGPVNPGVAGVTTVPLGPLDLTGLADGALTLEVVASDAAGNSTILSEAVAKRALGVASRFGFVANRDHDTVSSFTVDPSTGRLDAASYLPVGDQPFGIAIEPSGRFAFVTNSGDNTITVLERRGVGLSFHSTHATFAVQPEEIVIDPLGRSIYFIGQGDQSIRGLAIDPTTGLQALQTVAVSGYTDLRDVALHPSGRWLFLSYTNGADVVQAMRLAADGSSGPAPWPLAFSSADTTGLSVAPSGEFVFAADPVAGTVTTFAFDFIGETMTLASAVTPGTSPIATVVTPDGGFLYAALRDGDAIAQYAVDSVTGALSALAPATVAVATAPIEVSVSRDGMHLYVLHRDGDVSTLDIAVSGLLSNPRIAPTMGSPRGLAIFDTPASVGWTLRNVAAIEGTGLQLYSVNDADGVVTTFGSAAGLEAGASSLAFDVFLETVQVTNRLGGGGTGSVSSFGFDVLTGVFTPAGGSPLTTIEDTPTTVLIDPSARFAHVVASVSADLTAYDVGAGGALTSVALVGNPTALGGGGADEAAVFHPSGRFAYVVDPTVGDVLTVEFDLTTGVASVIDTDAVGPTPRAVVAHPSGRWLLVLQEGSDQVLPMAVAADGTVTAGIALALTVGAAPKAGVFTPDGTFAYALGGNDTIEIGSFDASTGSLSGVLAPVAVGTGAVGIAMSPRGDHLYVSNQDGGVATVLAFDIDSVTGALTPSATASGTTSTVGASGALHVIATFQ